MAARRFVNVFIDPNPNCPDGCGQRFQVIGDTREVRRIRYAAGDGTTLDCDVTGVGENGVPAAARAVGVEDSGAGTVTLLFGGAWGLRLTPRDGRPPFGEPYLLLDDDAIVE